MIEFLPIQLLIHEVEVAKRFIRLPLLHIGSAILYLLRYDVPIQNLIYDSYDADAYKSGCNSFT